jgi:hypothetical protein
VDEASFQQASNSKYQLREQVILDTDSKQDTFCNDRMISNIQTAKKPTTMYTNEGSTRLTKQGDFGTYARCWIDPDQMANILSFSRMSDMFHITFDNKIEDAYNIWIPEEDIPTKF